MIVATSLGLFLLGIIAIGVLQIAADGNGRKMGQQSSGSYSPNIYGNNNNVVITGSPTSGPSTPTPTPPTHTWSRLLSRMFGSEAAFVYDEQRRKSFERSTNSYPYVVPYVTHQARGDEVDFILLVGSKLEGEEAGPLEWLYGEITDTKAFEKLVASNGGRQPQGKTSWHTKRWIDGRLGRPIYPGGIFLDTHQVFEDTKSIEPFRIPAGTSDFEYGIDITANTGHFLEKLEMHRSSGVWTFDRVSWYLSVDGKKELIGRFHSA